MYTDASSGEKFDTTENELNVKLPKKLGALQPFLREGRVGGGGYMVSLPPGTLFSYPPRVIKNNLTLDIFAFR